MGRRAACSRPRSCWRSRRSPTRVGSTSDFFELRSRDIVCLSSPGGGASSSALLECGITSGPRPAPPRSGAACRELDDVADRVALGPQGRAEPIARASDAGPFAGGHPRVLADGRVWQASGYS